MADETREPKAEAAVDLGRLGTFLAQRAPEMGAVASLRQFVSGHSNLSYLLATDTAEFVLRRAPPGVTIAGAHDMAREFRTLNAVRGAFSKVPRPLLLCEDAGVIGSPFYVMERLSGVILRGVQPPGVALSATTLRRTSIALVEVLVEIHALDVHRGPLAALGKPAGFVERQVRGWRERWAQAKLTPCVNMDRVGEWLAMHLPQAGPPALLHNDFKYDNVVLSGDLSGVVGVLDWEMAALGDPLVDLGHSLALWAEASDPPALKAIALGPTPLPGSLTRAEVLDRYAQASGRDLSGMPFYLALGLFKFGVVVQQLFARFQRGLSTDARYEGLDPVMRGFAAAALHVAETGTLALS